MEAAFAKNLATAQYAAAFRRNAGTPADFFHLPAGRVIEMGAQVLI